jgi:phospholipid:diacylglycerol acyltransferase
LVALLLVHARRLRTRRVSLRRRWRRSLCLFDDWILAQSPLTPLQCDITDPSRECNISSTTRTLLDFPLARKQWIDAAVNVKGAIPEVRSGVKFGDGDGTIPVVSLGSMCVRGWKGKTPWNPAGIDVVTQGGLLPFESRGSADETEYKHAPESFDLRGGPQT